MNKIAPFFGRRKEATSHSPSASLEMSNPEFRMAIFRRLIILGCVLFHVMPVQAGMTVYDLNDVVQLRLQDISFFAVLLLLPALGVRLLWNYLAKDFSRLPRLSFLKALSLTALLGIGMLLVLVMISGARELLTPGAWHRQGSQYRPNEQGSMEARQRSLQGLRHALWQYADAHRGQFPPHDYVAEIPEKIWEAPDSAGTRYIYLGGQTLSQSNALVACEPAGFGEERLVLFSDGNVKTLKTSEIHELIDARDPP